MRYRAGLLAGLVWLAVAAQARGAQAVVVDKRPVTVETIRFEANDPPADMPPLEGEEAAVTRSSFGAATSMEVEVVDDQDNGAQTVSRVKVIGVKATISLNVRIWLPEGADKSLVEHEQGHRRISEQFYQDAEQAMRSAARKYIGQTVRGTGPNAQAARRNAMTTVIKRINQQYMAATQAPSARVNELFDRLTSHGRNKRLSADEGIRRATEQWRQEQGRSRAQQRE